MNTNRRGFLQGVIAAGLAPTIIPAKVLGADAPSKKVQIAIIGCGRVAYTMDLQGLVNNHDLARLHTLCDIDSQRLPVFRDSARQRYAHYKIDPGDIKLEQDYRKVLDDPGIDGVMVCTQDHWHARQVVEACLKGKDVYVQKPMAFSPEESQAIAEAVRKMKRVFHIGTQQRSDRDITPSFRRGVEYVQSGRLGKIVRIEVGITDNVPKFEDPFPVRERTPDPKDFDFDLWLGPARADVPYSQLRTHWRIPEPNGSLPFAGRHGRYMNNGWLQIQDYCTGNISGWGSHHIDIAQWGMGNPGPVSVKGLHAEFLHGRLFNVHDNAIIEYKYANGVEMIVGTPRYSGFPCGTRFIGENGDWIFVSRSAMRIAENKRIDTCRKAKSDIWYSLESNKKALITGEPEKQVKRDSLGHHRQWFLAMHERRDTNITVEEASCSTISCLLGFHAMNNVGYEIKWDPEKRVFVKPEDMKKFYSCHERKPFSTPDALAEIRRKCAKA